MFEDGYVLEENGDETGAERMRGYAEGGICVGDRVAVKVTDEFRALLYGHIAIDIGKFRGTGQG